MNDDFDPKETEDEEGLEDFNPEAEEDEEDLDELGMHSDTEEDLAEDDPEEAI